MTVIEAKLTTADGQRAVLIKGLPDALFEILKAEFPLEDDALLWRVTARLIVAFGDRAGVILE